MVSSQISAYSFWTSAGVLAIGGDLAAKDRVGLVEQPAHSALDPVGMDVVLLRELCHVFSPLRAARATLALTQTLWFLLFLLAVICSLRAEAPHRVENAAYREEKSVQARGPPQWST